MLCAQTEFARLLPACLWPYLVNLRRLASLALLDPLHAMMSAMLAIVGMSLGFSLWQVLASYRSENIKTLFNIFFYQSRP